MNIRILPGISALLLSCLISTNLAAQTPSGLIHYWPANGNGLDTVGSANCLTPNLLFTTGHASQAFSLDGTTIPDFGDSVGVFGTGDFTMAFWIQTTASDQQTILSRRLSCDDSTANFYECSLSGGPVSFQLTGSDGQSCTVTGSRVVNDGAFHQLVIVRNGLDLMLYIDGVLDALSSASSAINIAQISDGDATGPHLLLGNGPCVQDAVDGSPHHFVGALDEFQMFNRALGDSEIYLMSNANVGLAIVSQPFNQRTLVGRRVVMHVGAVGQDPITYQWRLNGFDIPGAISNNFEIASASLNDTGSYTVLVSNPTGAMTSRTAILVVTNLSTPDVGLIARWSAEGNATDSISGRHGVVHNVGYTRGVLGSAFKFNGTGGHIDCPNVMAGTGTNDFTIDFWMQTPFFEGADQGWASSEHWGWPWYETVLGERFVSGVSYPGQVDTIMFKYGVQLVNKYNLDGSANGWQVSPFLNFELGTSGEGNSTGSYRENVRETWNGSAATANYCSLDSSFSQVELNDGVFHHVAVVRRANQVSMYLDGRLARTATTRDPVNYSPPAWQLDTTFPGPRLRNWDYGTHFRMGTDTSALWQNELLSSFNGMLDEIQIHNRALSDAEVYNEYSPDPDLVILQSPQNSSVVEGHTANLSISAAGQMPIYYQWRQNGSDIAGATDSTYVIPTAQSSDAGTYSAKVWNATQTIITRDAAMAFVPSNSLLPGLVNRLSAEGNTDDLMGNATVRSFNAVYGPGINGQGFDLAFQGGTFDEATGDFGAGDFTLDFWIEQRFPPQPAGAESDILFKQFFPGGACPGYSFILSNQSMIFCGQDTETNAFSLISTPTNPGPLDDQGYHHIGLVRRGATQLEMYLDGALIAETNLSYLGSLSTPALFTLDNFTGLYNFGGFNGELDEIETYNRALSPAEIQTIYNRYANNPRVVTLTPLNNMELSLGDSVTLSTGKIFGPGPLSYQWTLNGVAIAGATNSVLPLTVGASSAGNYVLVVSNAYGSASCPSAIISLRLAPGSYNGLFYLDDDPTDDTSGYVTLTVDSSQIYSGKVLQHGHSYPFTGRFSAGKSVASTIVRTGKRSLRINLKAPADTGFDGIRGVVNDGFRVIPLQARRSVYSASSPTPQAGNYTLALTGIRSASAPNGHGFGNLTISSQGNINFIAKLADDTSASQGTMVANAGVWPVYIPLYGGKGSVLGWLSFTNSSDTRCAGELRWIKAPHSGGKNYPGGFATKVPIIASSFAPTAAGLGIDLNNYELVFDGAKIYSAVSDQLTTITGNTINFSQVSASTGTLTADPTTGQFSGTFIHPITKLKTPIKGIVLQEQGEAAGYFISGKLSGRVVLKPK